MGVPQPQTEDVEIFNEICGLDLYDICTKSAQLRLRELIWRLNRLVRQQQSNFVLRTASAVALVKTAQRDLALPDLEAAYALRRCDLVPVQRALIRAFVTIGDFTRALSLAKELTSNPELRAQEGVIINAAWTAFLAGDIEYLMELGEIAKSTNQDDLASQIIESFGADMLHHLPRHQKIVQSILQPYPCWVYCNLLDDGHEPLLLSVNYAVKCTKLERRALESKLVRALYDYYEENTDMPPGRGVAAFCPDLYEIVEDNGTEEEQ
ncbi:MAG: hypothetical protein WCK65_09610 [Rhodospirillaceae bacterium]